MSLPSPRLPDHEWKRLAKQKLDRIAGGYPFPQFDADPAGVDAGYTYFNSSTGKVRTWDGSAWNSHY